MKKFFSPLIIFSVFFSFYITHQLFAKRIYIVVDNAKIRKTNIAIASFKDLKNDKTAKSVGDGIRDVILSDLQFSNIFSFIEPGQNELLEMMGHEPQEINFKEWGALGAEFLIHGGYRLEGDRFVFEAKLYDIKQGRLIVGKNYKADRKDMRKVSHRFSDAVMEELTGEKGIFQTKILFISDKTGDKELYSVDFDGYPGSIEKLTHHKSIVLSPSWAPDGKKVSYSCYMTHPQHIQNLDLLVMDLEEREFEVISKEPGQNSGSSWSPDGKEIAVTLSFEGNPEIYLIDDEGENRRRLTTHREIDVEPSWSPDGEKIIFSSGRAPFAHLHIMNKDGSNVTRLTHAGKYNSTPAWSTRGDKIAFTAQIDAASFDLYLILANGTGLRRLTKTTRGKHNEYPSWSPDGRHIVFTSNRTGKYSLYVMTEDGDNERPLLKNFGNITSPEWSPYLQ